MKLSVHAPPLLSGAFPFLLQLVPSGKETGKALIYSAKTFREVTEVNLIAPIYWALEMVARIAEDRGRRGLGRWQQLV